MAYSHERCWGNLTQIGDPFSMTPIETGKKLKELGYRDVSGRPTAKAYKEKVVREIKSKNVGVFYLWHIDKFNDIFSDAGLFEKFGKDRSVFVLACMWVRHQQTFLNKPKDAYYHFYNKFIIDDVNKKGIFNEVNDYLLERNYSILLFQLQPA